ncbi:MAG: hypothetical protein ACYDB3_10190, partial [Acidimicrobiales bacterium]
NKMTAFTGAGLMPPIDWTKSHTQAVPPFCDAYVVASNGRFVPEFVQAGNQVFVCFDKGSDTPVAPPPGTPGT